MTKVYSTRYDTFTFKWVLERDGKVVATFPDEELAICSKLEVILNRGENR